MFMVTPSLDQTVMQADIRSRLNSEVGPAGPNSSAQVRRQFQQLIVWRGLQPRSQLIKVLRCCQPDIESVGLPPQETI
jgi:hypothetical protein